MVGNLTQIKNGVTINIDVNAKTWKKNHVYKKYYIWNPATYSCENRQYIASIVKNSVIMCDETTKETKTVPKKLFQQKALQQIYIFH